jgi:prophage antirepressor-like protein
MELNVVLTKQVNNTEVDGYYGAEQAWFTREQIGTALEYKDPRVAITKIHKRHSELLDEFSTVTNLVTVDGKEREVFVYSFKGVLVICRWSNQPKANVIMLALYEMAEQIMQKHIWGLNNAKERRHMNRHRSDIQKLPHEPRK